MKKEQNEGDFDQFVEVLFSTLHQYEPTVRARDAEKQAEFKSYQAEFEALYDKHDPVSEARKVELKENIEWFVGVETEHRSLVRTLRHSPDLKYFNEAAKTALELNSGREGYSEGVFYYYEEIFRSMNGSSRRIPVQALRNISSFVRYNEMLVQAASLEGDPANVVFRSINIWGENNKRIGIGDFVHKSLLSRLDPVSVNELIELSRSIAHNSLGRLEQNRQDATKLPSGLRDFVHDQLPDIHALITAIIKYYETGDESYMSPFIDKYWNGKEELKYLNPEIIMNREVYSSLCEEGDDEKVIDVLRRLEKNTEPIVESPSETGKLDFDRYLKELHTHVNDEGIINTEGGLQKALAEASRLLTEMESEGQVGIEPNFILALSWLDYQTSQYIRSKVLFRKDQNYLSEMYKQDWFKDSIRFYFRTNTTAAIEGADIEAFIDSVSLSPSSIVAYDQLAKKVIETVNLLSILRKAEGKTTDSLWTGNLADAFLSLGDDINLTRSYAINREKAISLIDAGNEEVVDRMYLAYQEFARSSMGELPTIKNKYSNQWEIGTIIKAMGLKSEKVQYGGVSTPINFMNLEYNGKKVRAAYIDEAGLALGYISIDGKLVQTKRELIEELRLPQVYSSVTREGD